MPTVESIPLPPSIDEHKHVRRHTQQLRELEEKLGAAQSHRATLVAERQQLTSAQHEADVAIALGDAAGVQPDRAPRLAQLDAEIVRADNEAAALGDALSRLTVIAAQGREQLELEQRQQIEATVRTVCAEMVPQVQQLIDVSQQLFTLAARAPGVLVPVSGLLVMFRDQVRALSGGRS